MTSTRFLTHYEGIPGLVEAIPDVAASSAVKPDIATEVGEFFGSWKIFSVHFDSFCLLLANLQTYLLCKPAETGRVLFCVLMSV